MNEISLEQDEQETILSKDTEPRTPSSRDAIMQEFGRNVNR